MFNLVRSHSGVIGTHHPILHESPPNFCEPLAFALNANALSTVDISGDYFQICL